jgi:site-specific DNA-methyltransferase (adenine-specific)
MNKLELNKYYLMDVLDGMHKIDDESVDIVLIDPPYNIGKDFGNNKDNMKLEDYIEWSKLWMNESIRILKPTGNIFIYGFSEILAHLSVNLNLNKRWLIWHYTNKTVPTYKSGWQRSHESIIWAYKNDAIFNVDDVREPYSETFLKNSAGKKRTKSDTARYGGYKDTVYEAHPGGALPRDVFTNISSLAGGAGSKERYFLLDGKFCLPSEMKNLSSEKKKDVVKHPTQKPLKLTERLLLSSKPSDGGLVVIPFAGSGSEGVVCIKLGMNFVGFDNNPIYISMSNSAVENWKFLVD